jgi:hypothetical protein
MWRGNGGLVGAHTRRSASDAFGRRWGGRVVLSAVIAHDDEILPFLACGGNIDSVDQAGRNAAPGEIIPSKNLSPNRPNSVGFCHAIQSDESDLQRL